LIALLYVAFEGFNLKHLDLFSGIGGFALAAQWAGIETVAFCEIDDFACKVLNKNFPGVPVHRDIRELDGGLYAGIDLITGGYPCQPFSVAGSQKAAEDDRHLWPEMFRVIAQAKPDWVVCENVYGHIALGLDDVLHDLDAIGYTAQPFAIPALAAGANHNRERVFIVAYTTSNGRDESQTTRSNEAADDNISRRTQQDSNNEGRCGLWSEMEWGGHSTWGGGAKPPALRVDDGIPNRVDRNKALGNAIVPQVAYEILRCIRDV
jgi:DNA (cytosine-5)-methyltransferase 1